VHLGSHEERRSLYVSWETFKGCERRENKIILKTRNTKYLKRDGEKRERNIQRKRSISSLKEKKGNIK
jgi:hypothetical protein